MPDYAVFGGRLRSALPLAGLAPLARDTQTPRWRLRVDHRPPPPATTPLAEVESGELRILFSALKDGWRLAYADTGAYDVSADGARWTWHPVPDASPELVQADILGRVAALALAAEGALALHGSCVTIGGRGVVFLAPKHAGKSTLAAALASAGARLAADDMAAIDPGPPARLRPGVPLLRLWDEAADRMEDVGGTRIPGEKQTLADLPAARVETQPVPLGAVYVLHPVEAMDVPVRRTRLAPTDAVLAMTAHAKLGPLLRGRPAATHLARASGVAATVPAYNLSVVRGFDRLPEVVTRILSWHHVRTRATA